MNSRAGIAAALLVCGSALSAQTIRGTLTDPTSHPVAGAVVVLLDTTSHQVARTLSSDRGDFAFQKIASGTYRLRILRIGYFPFESNAISSGATIQLQLPPTLIALDTFHVTAKPVCHTAPGDAATIYAAWDQVRTALTATQLTTDDHALVATTIRTERWLDVDGRRVLGENSASVSRPVEQPWHSVSGDVLHKSGYVDIRPDSITYRAPDLDALASDQFIDDHRFRVERSAGRVGIAFAPIPQRDNLPEITGTAWIDSSSAELRKVEYDYVHLAGLLGANAQAKLDFVKVRDGGWTLSRWSIQMPSVGRHSLPATSDCTCEGSRSCAETSRWCVATTIHYGYTRRLSSRATCATRSPTTLSPKPR